jgi:hypothetical protein
MKLGHYLKLAPRTVFFAQGFAAILGALTQTGVTLWMLGNIPDICSSDQSSSFTCPNGRTVFSSSVIWGLIGPDRLYSVGKRYSSLLHFFWIGALAPVVTWYAYKRTGKKIFKDVNWPLFFVGTYNVPPATGKFRLCACERGDTDFVPRYQLHFMGPCKLDLQRLHQE